MIINDVLDKAKGVISKYSNRNTKVYDPSKNDITVAKIELDGVIEATISQNTVTRSEQGIDSTYYAYYDVQEPLTLSVTVLPTAGCNSPLQYLSVKQKQLKGFFRIEVQENGNLIDTFRAHLISLPEINMRMDGVARTYVFGIISDSGVEYPVKTTNAPVADKSPYTGNAKTYPLAENEPVTRIPLLSISDINNES